MRNAAGPDATVLTLAGGIPDGPAPVVGILGGTFDPIHWAHLLVAEEARVQLGLREVILVPTGQPYHRAEQPAASPEDRLAMIRLAVADNPHLRASDVDIVRLGPNYSVDTVADVQRELGEGVPLAFIIGWDSLRDIHRWRTPDELARRCRLVAVRRPGAPDPDWATLEAAIPNARQRILALNAPLLDISATALRQRVARGWPLRYWTHAAVAAYIEERGLYREGASADS